MFRKFICSTKKLRRNKNKKKWNKIIYSFIPRVLSYVYSIPVFSS